MTESGVQTGGLVVESLRARARVGSWLGSWSDTCTGDAGWVCKWAGLAMAASGGLGRWLGG